MVVKTAPATIEDLYNEPGKAELIGGRIVRYMSTGEMPSWVAGKIFRSLAEYSERNSIGCAYTDNIGFIVGELPSARQSFSPDVSFLAGPRRKTMRFIQGAPTFAVEVRSESEYANANSETERATKRTDYFAAGTQVVWDVDPMGECIHAYRADAPLSMITFRRGEHADAEPAVPGWRVNADWIFS